MKILDSDVCIEILRGNEKVIEKRRTVADDVATTWITASELAYGAEKSRAPEQNTTLVTEFLATLPVLGLDLPERQQGSGPATAPETGRRHREGGYLPPPFKRPGQGRPEPPEAWPLDASPADAGAASASGFGFRFRTGATAYTDAIRLPFPSLRLLRRGSDALHTGSELSAMALPARGNAACAAGDCASSRPLAGANCFIFGLTP